MSPAASPLSIEDWAARRPGGATLRDVLEPLRRRLQAAAGDGVYVHVVGADALAARIAALEAAAAHLTVEACRQAMPLFGVPFAVKDNIDVAGMPTTAACPDFAHAAERDACAVARLLEAGAVCVGKTNLDQFATGLVGTRSPYGRPSSVLAADRVSGGSSSGSAVTVARGDVPFALGTDTAGSGRIPAGFNQIVGLKPTPGRVGTSGVVPACASVDCVSVFAHSVGDAGRVLAAIEGDDVLDPGSAFVRGPARFAGGALRIGVPTSPRLDGGGDGGAQAFGVALERLRALGHVPVPIDFAPLHAIGDSLYGGAWVAERLMATETLLVERPDVFDPAVRAVLEPALRVTGIDVFRARRSLQAAAREAERLWTQVDLLMVPTAPVHPSHADVDRDPVGANARLGTYTNFVNLLGWCALAVPATTTSSRLPFGVTFIAPPAHDAALVAFGLPWQQATALPSGSTGRVPSIDGLGRRPESRETVPLAVVGAHLSGLPLNGQLVERGATLLRAARTAPVYRLFELPGTVPAKPGLLRCDGASGARAIEVEVWDMPVAALGSFLALVPSPLALGRVALEDGSSVLGFLCEVHATVAATDITDTGGWRAHLADLADRASAHRLSFPPATPQEHP